MPSRSAILQEINAGGPASHDFVRRKYLAKLHDHTRRDTILYASNWAHSPPLPPPRRYRSIAKTYWA